MAVDTELLDRWVRQLRASSWLDPATAAGALPKVPTTTLGTLPTATADFRGRIIFVYGAAGVADAFYICVKSAADTYSWLELDAAGLAAIIGATALGGQLGGTIAAATVNATHSGSAHSHLLRYSNTAEVTTTSTGAVDLLTSSAVSIPITSGIIIEGVVRKTAGAAVAAGIGLKVNSTVTCEANTTQANIELWLSAASNAADTGSFRCEIPPRSANYLNVGSAFGTSANLNAGTFGYPYATAPMPNATITSFALRGIVGNALVTLAVKECAIWEVLYA